MKAPRIRVCGWSWLGLINFLFFQWFFVRLEGTVETPVVPGRSEMTLDFLTGVVPLTGWWQGYIFVGKNRDES